MSSELEKILSRIEELRQILEELVGERGTIDQEVVAASQTLDALLNEFSRLLRRKSEKQFS